MENNLKRKVNQAHNHRYHLIFQAKVKILQFNKTK